MCFDLPFKIRKGRFVSVRKRDGEDSEEIGLLEKEIEKWNKKKQVGVTQGEGGNHDLYPSNHK